MVLAILWSSVILLSMIWNLIQSRQSTFETARIQARVAYEKDITYRQWSADFGGVYVPVTEDTQPNPYLFGILERDIITLSGRELTLINPAYMTRQIHEMEEERSGVRGHITSVDPLRPENAPDAWELEALMSFESGEDEISSIEDMGGDEFLRLMRPLTTTQGCLACHAAQGYQVGDIRGGLSVSIPMQPLREVGRRQEMILVGGHSLLWLVGFSGIMVGSQRFKQFELERLQNRKELNELAIRDSLTGSLNRRHFFELAKIELVRAERYRHPIALIMIDIDYFKAVNDFNGHQLGDAVLIEMVRRLTKEKRKIDLIGRYGGDEFMLLLPETGRTEAAKAAERFRRLMAEEGMELGDHEYLVRVSCGVASMELGEKLTVEELIERSDKALYSAKQSGRNQIRLWPLEA
jgi:diguanylate cyclase (GGDEF)-like protein